MSVDTRGDTSDRALDGHGDENSAAPKRIATVPNALCLIRFIGSFVLAGVALAGEPVFFLWLFVILALTDLLDGKIAVWFHQRSELGAQLDTWADAAMYAALIFGACWLHWDQLHDEWGWILAVVLSYTMSTVAGLIKFGRWPSYHTRAAKVSWGLVLIAVVCLLAGWTIWPLRIAMTAVTIANIESTLLTLRLSEWRTDVSSIFHVDRDSPAHRSRRHHASDDGREEPVNESGRYDIDEQAKR